MKKGRFLARIGSFSESWWPVVIILALGTVVLYQRWQVTHRTRPEVLRVGQRLTPVELSTVDGHPYTLAWNGSNRPTIMYVFRPGCVWCQRNFQLVRALSLAESGHNLVAVSTSRAGLADYVKQHELTYPVYVASQGGVGIDQLRLSGTPETIVVDTDGTVKNVWWGAYGGSVGKEIQAMFHISLPNTE